MVERESPLAFERHFLLLAHPPDQLSRGGREEIDYFLVSGASRDRIAKRARARA